jgi:enoyl-CoA hydratase/carnithine racemase
MNERADSPAERNVTTEHCPIDGRNRAALIWLDRPDLLNAMTWEMLLDLERELNEADADETVSIILISGRGRAFSAGGDLKKYQVLQRDPVAFPRFVDDVHRVYSGISKLTKPVVALVNGVTGAGGLELLLSCDFAYAAASARIGDLHLNFGQMGGGGVLSLLPRMIGMARASELIYSGDLLDAEQALEWGLVNRVVPDDELMATGMAFAQRVTKKSPAALRNAKFVLNTGFADGTGLNTTMALERERNCLYVLTEPDAHEGLIAFAEKREPKFPGR